ncbi:MAG: hypothetical protein ACRCZY_04635 [Phocaeicola sp.]
MDKISELFDFQKFCSYGPLSELINSVGEEYSLQEVGVSGKELFDHLDQLNAAGEGKIENNVNKHGDWSEY